MAEVKKIKIDVDTKGAVDAMENLSKATYDVSQSFEEVYGDIQPLTTRMGEAEDRLYELAAAGQTTTQEYKDLLETVGRYRKIQIETDLAVDSAATTMAQKLGGALTGVAAGYSIVQGVMGTFGTESEQLEKTLLKVQSALAIVQGIQQFKESIPVIKQFANAIKVGAVGAFQSLKKAIITTGIGALVVALGYAADALNVFGDSTEDAEKEQKQLAKQLERTSEQLERQRNLYEGLGKRVEDQTRQEVLDAKKRGASEKEITAIKTAGSKRKIQLLEEEEEQARITYLNMSRNAKASEEEFDLADKAFKAAIARTRDAKLAFDEQVQAEQDAEKERRRAAGQAAAQKRRDELETLKEYQKEAANVFKTETEIEIQAINEKYDAQIKLAKKYKKDYEDLEIARLNAINDVNLKAQKEQDAIDEKIKQLEEQERQEKYKKEDEQWLKLQELTTDAFEFKKLQLQRQYDAEFELAKGNAELQTALTKKLESDLTAIDKEASDARIKTAKEEADKKKELETLKVQMVYDSLNMISELTTLFGQKNERVAKAMFNIDKAAKIASATMSAREAVINAYKTAQDSPLTAVLPAYPFIQAGLAGAFGAINVAKIASQRFQSSGGASDLASSGRGGGGATIPSASPSFNVVGNSGMNQLAQIQQTPLQAYVVSGEVTSAQALDRNRIKNATL